MAFACPNKFKWCADKLNQRTPNNIYLRAKISLRASSSNTGAASSFLHSRRRDSRYSLRSSALLKIKHQKPQGPALNYGAKWSSAKMTRLYLVLLSKKPAVMLWLATPSLCSAEALTCSSTVWTLVPKIKKGK